MNNVKQIRKNLNLSREQFAEDLGYSARHIQRLENEESEISKEFIEAVKKVYNIDMNNNMSLDSSNQAIARRVTALRGELTQYQFAKNVGINHSILSRGEKGGKISLNALKKIADHCNVGIEWLMYGIEEKKDYPVNNELVQWLWENKDIRKELWDKCKSK